MVGIMGYWDRLSARPGDAPELKVSIEDGSQTFRVDVVRLICGDDGPNGPGFKIRSITSDVNGTYPGRRKAIPAGSYVHIPNMNAIRGEAITFAALVMPTSLGKRATQCIVSRQHRSSKGVALTIDPSGRGGLWLHDGAGEVLVTCDSAMRERCWYLLVASFDASVGRVRILQRPVGGAHRIEGDVIEDRSSRPSNAFTAGRSGDDRGSPRSGSRRRRAF